MVADEPVDIYREPQRRDLSLLVCWQTQDMGKLCTRTVDLLTQRLGGEVIAEIKSPGFFPMGGVRFRGDVAQAPESKFWLCEGFPLLIFLSDEPIFEHYAFLNLVLDLAVDRWKVRETTMLSGAVSLIAHTHPRRILTVYNQPALQAGLRGQGLVDMTWEGPPAISSYLLWVAARRRLPAMSLWPEIPFYLAGIQDPHAVRATLSFLDRHWALGFDVGTLDREIHELNRKMACLQEENAEVDRLVHALENGLPLNDQEQLTLTKDVDEYLGRDEKVGSSVAGAVAT